MPTRIYNAGPTSGLITEFDVKGKFSPLLDEVVVPVAIVADVRDKGVIVNPTYWATIPTAAVVGEHAIMEFRGLPGFIIQPISLLLDFAAATDVVFRQDGSGVTPLFTGDLAAVGVSDKSPHFGSPVLVHAGNQVAAGTGVIVSDYRMNTSTAQFHRWDLRGWELDEDNALNCAVNGLNASCNFSAQWRFRAVEG